MTRKKIFILSIVIILLFIVTFIPNLTTKQTHEETVNLVSDSVLTETTQKPTFTEKPDKDKSTSSPKNKTTSEPKKSNEQNKDKSTKATDSNNKISDSDNKSVSNNKTVSNSGSSFTKTPTNSFKDTMYDYSKAGMSCCTSGLVSSSEYISVSDFGVTGTESSDVSSKVKKAILEANSKGKYLYFPKGVYYIKQLTISDCSNVKLCGDGNQTILKTANDAKASEWHIALAFKNCNNLTIRNIVFNGNNKNVSGDTEQGVVQLRLEACKNVNIYGCRFEDNNSSNINIVSKLQNLNLYYCDFLNSDCAIITSPGCIDGGYICNNFFDGEDWPYSETISLYYSNGSGTNNNLIISGNDFRNHSQNAGAVFISYPSENITVSHNYFYKCGSGIGSGTERQTTSNNIGPSHITVTNNVIDSPSWHGITILGATAWNIENNIIKNLTDGWAFHLTDCSNNVIKNNSTNGSKIVTSGLCQNNLTSNNN